MGLGDAAEERLHLRLERAELLVEVPVGVHQRRELEVRALDRLLVGLLADAEQRVVIEVVEPVEHVEDALLLIRREVDLLVELLRVVLRRAARSTRTRGSCVRSRAGAGSAFATGAFGSMSSTTPSFSSFSSVFSTWNSGRPVSRASCFRPESAVDAGQQEPVRRVELELADVDAGDQPRDLLRHRTGSISGAVVRPLLP